MAYWAQRKTGVQPQLQLHTFSTAREVLQKGLRSCTVDMSISTAKLVNLEVRFYPMNFATGPLQLYAFSTVLSLAVQSWKGEPDVSRLNFGVATLIPAEFKEASCRIENMATSGLPLFPLAVVVLLLCRVF